MNCHALKGVAEIIILFLALAKFLKPILTDKLIVFFHKCFLLMMADLVINISLHYPV